MKEICFFAGAIGTLGGAIAVIGLRNPFYSVLALIVHLISLAGLFLLLQAEFMAAAQIVVYAGAVMVLYVFVAAYVGTHGMAHGLDTVLEAAELLRDVPEVLFLLVGDGARREHLVQRCASMQLDNVVMLGQQPKSMMPTIWAMCSFASGWKTITSSRRFRNSGLNTCWSSSFTFS